MKTKECRKCKEEYPLTKTNFFKDITRTDGYQNYCKSCAKDKQRAYVKANFAKVAKKQRQYYFDNLEQRKEVMKQYIKSIPAGVYKITNKEGKILYIGSTHEPKRRRNEHFTKLVNLKKAKSKSNICYAISVGELNKDNLRFKMIKKIADKTDRYAEERRLLRLYNPPYNERV